MVDASDGSTVFRTVYEERAHQIALRFQADGRMLQRQSYDYSVPGQLTITCLETAFGRPFVFVLTSKTSATQVNRDLDKAITTYDRNA